MNLDHVFSNELFITAIGAIGFTCIIGSYLARYYYKFPSTVIGSFRLIGCGCLLLFLFLFCKYLSEEYFLKPLLHNEFFAVPILIFAVFILFIPIAGMIALVKRDKTEQSTENSKP